MPLPSQHAALDALVDLIVDEVVREIEAEELERIDGVQHEEKCMAQPEKLVDRVTT